MSTPAAIHAANSDSLVIAECFGDTFPTFQGEGPSSGTPALFIRLSRCNLTCGWCDTRFTWDWKNYDPRSESARRTAGDLAAWATDADVEMVVITGGEPWLQQQGLITLVRRLLADGKRIAFETVPARGWHLTQRMHILAFGDKRGR
jgi:7-carboxy-7-deazaguanine synthase